MGPCSARMMQVAAYPTRGPSSGKRPRISEETLPTSRGRILNVSMALATLGLVILVRASICWLVSGTGGPPWGTVECLDGALALLDEHLLELFDHGFDLREVWIDLEGPLEIREGLLGLTEPEIDLAVAAEHAPVVRVALHHLVAVLERFLVLSRQEIDGGALVPAFREVRPRLDDFGEGLDGARGIAAAHLLDSHREEGVHLVVAGAAPHLPDGALSQRAHHLVGVAQRLHHGGQVRGLAELAEPCRGLPAPFEIRAGERGQGLLARHARLRLRLGLGGRREQEDRPSSLRNSPSSRMVTRRRLASSALEPGSSPATT